MNENVAIPREHRFIRDLLRAEHNGAIRAISQADLAAKTGFRKRRVRQIIRDLISQFGEPIGSLYARSGGYFWISSRMETELTCKKMTDHAVSQLSRVADLKKITLPDLLGQMRMDL